MPATDFLKELGFEDVAEVPPSVLAERWIAAKGRGARSYGSYIRLRPPQIEVLSQEPATVAGAPAFRLHWKEREPNGLCIGNLTYGVRLDDRVYLFHRRAPALVYFEPFVPAFEQLVAGFEPVTNDAMKR